MNELLRRLLFLPPQASQMATEVDTLHYFVIGVTMFASTLVGVIAWAFIVRHRRRTHFDTTVRVHSTLAFEIPMIAGTLVLFVSWWVIGFRQYVRMETPPSNAIDVYVMAKQWMWKFSYADGPSAVERLTVPAGRPVRLIMTSRDVIHSFYVPALRMKQDVIPGRYTTMWFNADRPGTYPIYCAEYCGVSHSRMRGELVVLSDDDYDAWLAGSEAQAVAERTAHPSAGEDILNTDLPSIGRSVATRRACFACHTADGQKHIGPTWLGLYMSRVPLTDGRVVTADEAYLTKSMMEPKADIVAGYRPIMPTYHGILEEPETAALVEFIKTLRDATPNPSVVLPSVDMKPQP
jgi:cytochrome c oxidase subunit 2